MKQAETPFDDFFLNGLVTICVE